MALQQILPTWVALNAANSPSASGMSDIRTGDPVYGGGLSSGDYFDVTEKEAAAHSYSVNGTLHAGRYRWVLLSSAATPANQGIGKLGFMPAVIPIPTSPGSLNIVTTVDLGLTSATASVHVVVFLNVVTPGNWCFVQELGIANVSISAAVTGPPLVITVGTLGNASVAGTTAVIGYAMDALASAGIGRVLLNLPVVQG